MGGGKGPQGIDICPQPAESAEGPAQIRAVGAEGFLKQRKVEEPCKEMKAAPGSLGGMEGIKMCVCVCWQGLGVFVVQAKELGIYARDTREPWRATGKGAAP